MWAWSIAALVSVPVVGVFAWLGATHAWFAQYHRHKGLRIRPASLAEHLSYYLGEALALTVVGMWHVHALWSDGLRNPRGDERPVLLVHGFTQNATNVWGLRRRLERDGHPTWAVSLGLPFRPIETHARRLHKALQAAVDRFPGGVDVVAHSMGGVVLRHVLRETPALAERVRTVVTLGTPHHGTASSRGMPLPHCDLEQMKRRSSWLAALPGFARHIDVVTVAAERDFVVYPSSTCHLPGARHVQIAGVGHAGLLTNRRVHEAVVQHLQPEAALRSA